MELTRVGIRMCRQKKKVVSQITMDEDFIVPDIKPDMELIAAQGGGAQIEEVRRLSQKAELKGKLDWRLIYYPPEGGALQSMEGAIPFDEAVHVPELEEKDYLQAAAELEDLTIELIHSRKISVKAIITFTLEAVGLDERQAVTDVSDTVLVETRKKRIRAAQAAVCRKDTYRVKEELELSGSQPDIEELLWRQCGLRNVQARPLDGSISLQGVLDVFCVYRGIEDPAKPQWLERELTFSGNLELPEAAEEMYPEITVRLTHCQLEVQPDFDGENRSVTADAVLELDIRLYEEDELQVVSDVHSPAKVLEPEYITVPVEEILVRNSSRTRVSGKLKCKTPDSVLQICHVDGTVKVDSVRPEKDGLSLEGALCVTMLFMTDSDTRPLQSVKGAVPFQYQIEAGGMDALGLYRLNAGLEQLDAVMLGGGEVELKAAVIFELLARKVSEEQMVTGITEKEPDLKRLQSLPGMVIYAVQPKDSLWSIAKRFGSSVASIRQVNGLGEEELTPGSRLLIVKQAGEAI